MDFQNFIESDFVQKIIHSKTFIFLELVFSIVVGITISLPVWSVLLGLNELLRQTVRLCLWLVYGDKIVLNDDEVGNNYNLESGDDGGRVNILYLGEVEGALNVEAVRENYRKRVIANKTYKKLTYTFHRKWFYLCMKKCENFDIDNHVRYYPGTENKVVTDTELMKKILPDLSRPMSPERPQWEEVIIPYYKQALDEERTRSLRIIRIHHSYMDGACTLMMIANTFCEEGIEFPYVIDPCKPLNVPRAKLLLYKLVSLAYFTTSVIQNILSPPVLRARKSRYTTEWGATSDVNFGVTKKIPIEHFNRIKEKTGVSMSAIVSTVMGGAMTKLEMKYSKRWYGTEKVPEYQPLWLVCGMFPYKKDKMCNNHLALETKLKVAQLSGQERLRLNHEELGLLAKNPLVNVYFWYVKIIGRIPCLIANIFLSLGVAPVILSNIPLCTKPIDFSLQEKRYQVNGIIGWVPLIARTGLGIVSVRYGDHFRYCVQADSNVLNEEELNYFVNQLEQQVQDLVLETSHLQRKISHERSLFRHDENKAPQRRRRNENGDDISNSPLFESDEERQDSSNGGSPDCIIKTNNNNDINKFSSVKNSNYSVFFKIKDSIEQIRDGIRKVKEQ